MTGTRCKRLFSKIISLSMIIFLLLGFPVDAAISLDGGVDKGWKVILSLNNQYDYIED